MSSDSDDKCLVCRKAGRNLNIFNTYNMRKEKEELYVEVIKNCFNIEIVPGCGLDFLCNECGMKLKKAYNFRHELLQAVEKLVSAQVKNTNEKQFSEIEYLEDIPFESNYDMDTILNPETGQISYALDEILEDKEINENDDANFLIALNNDAVIDNVLFDKIDDYASQVKHDDEIGLDKDDLEINLDPGEVSLLDKPVENFEIDLLSDVLVNNDLEPGEIRVIDKTVGQYLINAKNEIVIDKKKVIVKGKGKINATSKNAVKSIVKKKAGPAKKKTVNIVTVDDGATDENGQISKSDVDKKCVSKNVRKKVKTVLDELGTFDEVNAKHPTVVKNKRIAKNTKKDELSLLAQICTKQPIEIKQGSENDEISLMDIDKDDDTKASKESKSGRKSKKTAGKKEDAEKGDASDVEAVKTKKPKKKNKAKPPATPFTLRPDQTACDHCKARFETPRALSNHMNTHYPQFVCGECGVEVATKNRLRQHMRVHDEGPFACKICDKEFTNSNTRNAHTWRVHSKGDPFKCRRCDARFPTYLQRLRHMESEHEAKQEYACQFCPAKFRYAAYRTKHIRTLHLNVRPHACPHCPMSFARARNLAAHRASKHGEGRKPHRCPTCGVSFYFRSALRWHVSQHRHKYECNQCDQRFATSPELASHLQIHAHADNMAVGLEFAASLHLDAFADDYALIDPAYLDLHEL